MKAEEGEGGRRSEGSSDKATRESVSVLFRRAFAMSST